MARRRSANSAGFAPSTRTVQIAPEGPEQQLVASMRCPAQFTGILASGLVPIWEVGC